MMEKMSNVSKIVIILAEFIVLVKMKINVKIGVYSIDNLKLVFATPLMDITTIM